MSQNKIATRPTEYEILMNQAAQHLLTLKFETMRSINYAFIDYIEARSKCYSRKSIMCDSVICLSVNRRGLVWEDRNGRTKHNPKELQRLKSITTQPSPRQPTDDEKRIQSVLGAIEYAGKTTGKKHKKSRKVIGR